MPPQLPIPSSRRSSLRTTLKSNNKNGPTIINTDRNRNTYHIPDTKIGVGINNVLQSANITNVITNGINKEKPSIDISNIMPTYTTDTNIHKHLMINNNIVQEIHKNVTIVEVLSYKSYMKYYVYIIYNHI